MKRVVAVTVDGVARRVAAGLQVRSLLTPDQLAAVARGELAVLDGRGRERGLGGALLDGQVLTLAPRHRG